MPEICKHYHLPLEKPTLEIYPLSQTMQIHRCNKQLKFEVDIIAIPSDIAQLDLVWFKDIENQTINYGDTRIDLFKGYSHQQANNSSSSIRAGISIHNLVPEDSGLYILRVGFMGDLIKLNETLQLKVIACHISKTF